MNLSEIEYKIKTASYESIVDHLNRCSDYFSPPLNTYVNIEEYGKKIYDNAVTFECWNGKILIGLVGAYFNNKIEGSGFITNVSVLKRFQNYGIASALVSNAINYARQNNFLEINLEVNKKNNNANKLYEKHGFIIAKQNSNTFIMNLKLSKS